MESKIKNIECVPTPLNSPTMLRSREGLRRFKYSFFISSSKVHFKDKIMNESMFQNEQYLRCLVIDSDSIIELGIRTLAPTVGPIMELSVP